MRGSVYKRGKTWAYSVYLGSDAATGKKRYKQRGGFPTKRACDDALRQLVDRVRTGDYAEAGSTTVGEFLDRWLDAITPTVRPTTAASYRRLLETHARPTLGSVKLSKLTGLDLSSLYGTLLVSGYRKGKTPRGLSPTSVRLIHRIVTHALRDAVRWGLLARNPADQVDPPRTAEHEMPTWSASLVRRAGLPTIRLHDLRHTAATLALAAGIHPKIVSERLGHATVQLTLDRYSHVVDGLQERAAQQLGVLRYVRSQQPSRDDHRSGRNLESGSARRRSSTHFRRIDPHRRLGPLARVDGPVTLNLLSHGAFPAPVTGTLSAPE